MDMVVIDPASPAPRPRSSDKLSMCRYVRDRAFPNFPWANSVEHDAWSEIVHRCGGGRRGLAGIQGRIASRAARLLRREISDPACATRSSKSLALPHVLNIKQTISDLMRSDEPPM